jgi:hypothetical protein
VVEVWRESQILKFERRQDKGVPESSLDWEDPTPELSEASTFREASLTKRGDLVRRRQPGQGRRLSKCPGARRSGRADPGHARPRPGQGPEEEQNGGGDSPKLETESIQRGGRASSQGLPQGPNCLELGEACFLPGFSTKC